MVDIIFGLNRTQNDFKKVKLFLIWFSLTGIHANIQAFIIHHLVEAAETTYENVIGVVTP